MLVLLNYFTPGGKEPSEAVQGPYRHAEPVLTCMVTSWNGVSSGELLSSDHCILCPGVSETPNICFMVPCFMFQRASWTERKVGHWCTRENRRKFQTYTTTISLEDALLEGDKDLALSQALLLLSRIKPSNSTGLIM